MYRLKTNGVVRVWTRKEICNIMKYKDYSKNELNITKLQTYITNNISLTEDSSVRNYKTMCDLLGEEPTDGNSRKAQINRWKRYFDFHKEGQKFIIDEIYDEPFPTDDARKRREGLYVKYIELLLLEFLSRQQDYKVTVGNKEMYRILGMTNDRYEIRNKLGITRGNEVIRQTIMNNKDEFVFSEFPMVSSFDVNNFYFRAEQKLNKILYSALRSMKNRFLIDYKKVNIIAEPDPVTHILEYRESNAYEDKLILEAKSYVVKEMGFNNMMEIMLCYKSDEFFERFNDYIKNEYGWDRCYPRLRVVYIDDIAKQIPLKAEEIKRLSTEDKKTQLNAEIIKCLNTQAEKKYEDNWNKFLDGESDRLSKQEEKVDKLSTDTSADTNEFLIESKKEKPFLYRSNYVEIQRALTDYLLNIHFKQLDVNPKKETANSVETNVNTDIDKEFIELIELLDNL